MVNPTIEREVLDVLARLTEDRQREVVEFARSLEEKELPGISGKELLKFAGCIPADVCDQMEKAINEGCERIDLDGW